MSTQKALYSSKKSPVYLRKKHCIPVKEAQHIRTRNSEYQHKEPQMSAQRALHVRTMNPVYPHKDLADIHSLGFRDCISANEPCCILE